MYDMSRGNSLEAVLQQLGQVPDENAAWSNLIESTWPFVVAMCHRALQPQRRVCDADDLAQEVYLRFSRYWHEKRPTVRDRDSLFSLLAVIVRRMATDFGRWRTRKRRDVGRQQATSGSEVDDTAFEYEEVELRDILDRVCEEIDGEHRMILSLRLQGYTVAEIAEKLAISERTIERRIQDLRQILGPHLTV